MKRALSAYDSTGRSDGRQEIGEIVPGPWPRVDYRFGASGKCGHRKRGGAAQADKAGRRWPEGGQVAGRKENPGTHSRFGDLSTRNRQRPVSSLIRAQMLPSGSTRRMPDAIGGIMPAGRIFSTFLFAFG